MTAQTICTVCGKGDAPVCERCFTRMAEQLAALPALRDRLRAALVPGSGGGGERVSTGKGEPPLPARLAALSLLAAGSDDARCLFVPAVRVWITHEAVIPMRPVVRWHREALRDEHGRIVMTLADDQVGVLPIQEWLRAWALQWARSLGYRPDGAHVRQRRRPPAIHLDRARRQLAAQLAAQLGIGPAVPAAQRPDDPVALEWDQRWPATGWGPVFGRYHAYLSIRLPLACDQLPYIADFAASLRTLTGAIRAALGDVDDLEYLGRCPEMIDDHVTGMHVACGAEIWHDPYASVVACPRCHAETGADQRVWLARRILDVWPIDRRRRYPRGLIEILRIPACATCGKPVSVEWVGATERADREPFWRPGTVACRSGCQTAE